MTQLDREIQHLFNEVSIKLADLEDKIREGYDTPMENIDRDKFSRIRIPQSYIRKKSRFITEYSLSALVGKNRMLYNNVAYALQLSDLYNFLINRFHMFGAIQNQFLKNCIVHNFSIVESILLEVINDLGAHCRMENGETCPKHITCNSFVNHSIHLKAKQIENILREKLKFPATLISNYLKIVNIRNYIHMKLVDFNEYFDIDKNYSIATYNQSIKLLKFIKSDLLNNIESFLIEREGNCDMRN